jgi:hypothetical protein
MKKSLGFEIFWFLVVFSPMFSIIFVLLLPLKLDNYLSILISLVIAFFYAKIEIYKQDLENEIFDLKETIKNKL